MARIPLTRGRVALVDDADRELVEASGPWYPCPSNKTTYAMANVRRDDGGRTTLSMHRLLVPTADRVDHINGDGLDNRRANLRAADRIENGRNMRPRGPSGFKGITFRKPPWRGKPWHARISYDGKLHHLGCFDSPEEAARAYDAAAIQHFGEFARLNFPKEHVHVDH